MKKWIYIAGLALLATGLSACGFADLSHDPKAAFDDPDIFRSADDLVGALLANDEEAVRSMTAEPIRAVEEFDGQLQHILEIIPEGRGVTSNHYHSEIRYGFDNDPEHIVYGLAYEIVDGEDIFNLSLFLIQEDDACCKAVAINVDQQLFLPSQDFKLTFADKGPLHYLIFALLIVLPIFMVATAIACFRNPNVRRKWVWIPFILIGLWGVDFNWTTGAVFFDLFHIYPDGSFTSHFLSFQLLGAGILKAGLYQPWILSLGSPIGAVLYWVWGRRGSRLDDADAMMA